MHTHTYEGMHTYNTHVRARTHAHVHRDTCSRTRTYACAHTGSQGRRGQDLRRREGPAQHGGPRPGSSATVPMPSRVPPLQIRAPQALAGRQLPGLGRERCGGRGHLPRPRPTAHLSLPKERRLLQTRKQRDARRRSFSALPAARSRACPLTRMIPRRSEPWEPAA